MISRVRKNRAGFGQNPMELKSLVIVCKLTETYKGRKLYWDDSGPSDPDRIILFTTPSNIEYLNKYGDCYGDGTFDFDPFLFCQLYSIHIIVSGKSFPIAYAFLANKKQLTYERLFRIITRSITNVPRSFNCDFEKTVFDAARKVFRENGRIFSSMVVIFT